VSALKAHRAAQLQERMAAGSAPVPSVLLDSSGVLNSRLSCLPLLGTATRFPG
jgi:hypothetical protein